MKEKLMELVAERNTNISQIAKATGIPKTTLYSAINDAKENRGVNAETLYKLSKYFNVPMEYFMGE